MVTLYGGPNGPAPPNAAALAGNSAPPAKPAGAAPPAGDPGANFLRALAAASGPTYGSSNMPDYTGQFQSALQAARGNISQQLHGALSDIANSQQKAQEALGQYAPMVNADYAEGMGNANSAVNAIQAANAKAGISTLMAPGAILTPDRNAVKATHAEDLADQALLNTGIGQAAAHDTSLANLAAIQAQGGLDQNALQFQQQQALAAQQNAFQQDQARQNFGYGLIQNQLATTQQAKTAANNNPATGPYKDSGLTQSQLDDIKASPKYKRYSSLLADPNANIQMIINELQATGQTGLLSVLESEHPELTNANSLSAAQKNMAAKSSPSNSFWQYPYGGAYKFVG